MKTMIVAFNLIFLLFLFSVVALDVTYTITFIGTNESVVYTSSLTEQQTCGSNCTFALPIFALPEHVVFSNYSLTNITDNQEERDSIVVFSSSSTITSSNVDDSILIVVSDALAGGNTTPHVLYTPNVTIEEPILENTTTAPVCSSEYCNVTCTICNDGVCHDPAFTCIEKASLEKYLPTTLGLGRQQLNILLRNTGTVALTNVSVYVSGPGISTVSTLPLNTLLVGEKDYVFVTADIKQSGVHDLVLKIFFNGKIQDKLVEQLTVLDEQKPASSSEEINATALAQQLEQLKEEYRDLEQEYQNKKIDGYTVDLVYDRLKETHDSIIQAQEAFFDGNYAKVKGHAALATDGLSALAQQLQIVKKPEQKFTDKLKANLVYIGTISAAIVSVFTATGLIKAHINKQKILDLEKRLRFKKQQGAGKNTSDAVSGKPAKKMGLKKESNRKGPEDDEDLKQNISEKMLDE